MTEFRQSGTTHYRGYTIIDGAIRDLSGQPVWLTVTSLNPTPAERVQVTSAAKAWIDRQIDG